MTARLRAIIAASIALLACLPMGCQVQSKPSRKPDIEGGLRKNIPAFDRMLSEVDVSQIALAYGNYVTTTSSAPKSIKDLAPYYQNDKKLNKFLEDGAIVVAWGADPTRLPADTIIGYQKRPMEDGRRIVMVGAGGIPGVKVMSQAEFDAAPKAKGLEGTGTKHGGRVREQ